MKTVFLFSIKNNYKLEEPIPNIPFEAITSTTSILHIQYNESPNNKNKITTTPLSNRNDSRKTKCNSDNSKRENCEGKNRRKISKMK